MIPFGTGDIPTNSTEAAQRLESAVRQITGAAGPTAKIDCNMASPEEITLLSIDISNLDGARGRAKKPASLTRLGEVNLQEFNVIGRPALVYGAPANVEIHGTNIPSIWSRDDHGNLWLVPSKDASSDKATPASGKVELSGRAADLEAVVRTAVAEIADANGARLKDLQLRLESSGPRSLLIAVDVVAAKFMMNAKVRALAEASLDDEMNLRIGRVDLTGEGTAGSMVANFLKPKLFAWNGRQIALGQYMFAGAALRDVQLEVGEEIRFSARFGQ